MIRSIAMAALLFLPLAAHAVEVAGVTLPDSVTVAGRRLVLNGAGVRTKLFLKVYLVALYLPSRASAASEVLALPGPERLSMILLRDVTAPQLIDALQTGLDDNHTDAEMAALRPRLEALYRVVHGIKSARSGSVITLDYVPGVGTQVALDGVSTGPAVPGDDFYRALLRIWLGDDPASSLLKEALLGAS